MEKEGGKDSNGLMKLVQSVKSRRSVINRRLEAGRTIQITLNSKAQLLTTIFENGENSGLTQSSIIPDGHIPRIVVFARPFEPEVLISVSTVARSSKNDV